MQMPPTQSKIRIRAQDGRKKGGKEGGKWRREDQEQLSNPPRSFCAVSQSSVVPNLLIHSPVKDSMQPKKEKPTQADLTTVMVRQHHHVMTKRSTAHGLMKRSTAHAGPGDTTSTS